MVEVAQDHVLWCALVLSGVEPLVAAIRVFIS